MLQKFPRVYPILDVSFIPKVNREQHLHDLGTALTQAGVTLLEYRNKTGDDSELLADAEILRQAMPAGQVRLILDDRAELVAKAGFDGVHVDAGDLSPKDARRIIGHDRILGTFGGGEDLLPGILLEPADYFAIGPVFATTTKQTGNAPIGINGVKRLRERAGAGVTLTAAAGITFETAALVLAAGASSVAVAAAIFKTPDPGTEFRRWLDALQ